MSNVLNGHTKLKVPFLVVWDENICSHPESLSVGVDLLSLLFLMGPVLLVQKMCLLEGLDSDVYDEAT